MLASGSSPSHACQPSGTHGYFTGIWTHTHAAYQQLLRVPQALVNLCRAWSNLPARYVQMLLCQITRYFSCRAKLSVQSVMQSWSLSMSCVPPCLMS